jgi:hypothetical protein
LAISRPGVADVSAETALEVSETPPGGVDISAEFQAQLNII